VLTRDRDDRGIGLGMTREPLALRGLVPGLGIGRRVGPEDLVIPDRRDLVEVGFASVADRNF
jgi:hypothetical protein